MDLGYLRGIVVIIEAGFRIERFGDLPGPGPNEQRVERSQLALDQKVGALGLQVFELPGKTRILEQPGVRLQAASDSGPIHRRSCPLTGFRESYGSPCPWQKLGSVKNGGWKA